MSRKHRRQVETVTETVTTPTEADVPRERRCPSCWGGQRGTGIQYDARGCSGTVTGLRRYWKCNQCGHSWSSDHQMTTVRVNHRMPPPLETRCLVEAQ